MPNGLSFNIPELKWTVPGSLPAYSSFNTIVTGVIAVRKANPFVTEKNGWSTDQVEVADEVDAYNAKICEHMGWTKFIITASNAPPPPKFKALTHQDQKQLGVVAGHARKIWAGVKTLNDWIDSGEPAVSKELSESRAKICVACPLNGEGGLEVWFTKPAADAIRRQFEKLESRKLTTTQDAKLNVCTACSCPLRLKCHTPMKFIKPHLTDEVINELAKGKSCWILGEASA